MILVRDIFRLKYGKAKQAKEMLPKWEVLVKKYIKKPGRALFDLTGKAYTLVMENEFENLSDFENTLKTAFSDKEWQEVYGEFSVLVESSYREIFTIYKS